MAVFSFPVKVEATLYVKADTLDEARALAAGIPALSDIALSERGTPELEVSAARVDGPFLPVLSLSPAATLYRPSASRLEKHEQVA